MFSFSVGVFGVASRSCSFPSSIRELFSDAILKSLSLASRAKRLVLFQDAAPPTLAVSAEYQWIQIVKEGGDLPNWGKASAGENCLQMPSTTNPDLLNNGKWGVGRRSSPKCFACDETFENRL